MLAAHVTATATHWFTVVFTGASPTCAGRASPTHATCAATRDANPGTTPCASTLAVRRIGNALPLRTADTTCAACARSRRRPPRSDSRLFRCRCMPPMRSSWLRVSFAPAAPGQSQSACHAAQIEAGHASSPNVGSRAACNRRKCFRNASLFGRRSRHTRSDVSASMPQCVLNEAGRPSAHASRRCRQAHATQYVDETLQDVTARGSSVAHVRSHVAIQGEYGCVRMHLVRVTYRRDWRAETNAMRRWRCPDRDFCPRYNPYPQTHSTAARNVISPVRRQKNRRPPDIVRLPQRLSASIFCVSSIHA